MSRSDGASTTWFVSNLTVSVLKVVSIQSADTTFEVQENNQRKSEVCPRLHYRCVVIYESKWTQVPEGIRGKLLDIVICLVFQIAMLIDTYELLSAECVTRWWHVSRCVCLDRGGEFYVCSSVHRNSRLKKSNKMQLFAHICLLLNYLILSVRRVLYVVCFLLGNSPASEF